MASLLDRINNIFKRRPQIDTNQGYASYGLSEDSRYWNPSLSPHNQEQIFKVLENCGIKHDANNPYEQMRASRFMYNTFPFAKKATNDVARMAGNIKIEIRDEQPDSELIEEVNELVKQFPILSESNWETPHEYGVDNFIYRAAITMLVDGMFFKESRYKNNALSPKNYQGCLVFDSMNYHFQKSDPDKPYQLYYKSDQEAAKTGYFDYAGFDFRNNHPWAHPLLSGGSFFIEVLTSAFVAIKNVNMRKANPLEVYGLKVSDDAALKDPNTSKAYLKSLGAMESSMVKGAKGQKEGKGGVIVSKVPMGVEVFSKAFGTDALQEIDPALVDRVLVIIANLLEVPVEQLGIVLGGAGFSPERFRIMFKIFGAKITDIRNKLQPIVLFELKNYFRAIGYDPAIIERLKIEFKDPDIQDDKEKAETSKLVAEANVKHMEVIELMNGANFPREAMEAYAKEHGLVEESVKLDIEFPDPPDPFEQMPGQQPAPNEQDKKEFIYN